MEKWGINYSKHSPWRQEATDHPFVIYVCVKCPQGRVCPALTWKCMTHGTFLKGVKSRKVHSQAGMPVPWYLYPGLHLSALLSTYLWLVLIYMMIWPPCNMAAPIPQLYPMETEKRRELRRKKGKTKHPQKYAIRSQNWLCHTCKGVWEMHFFQ